MALLFREDAYLKSCTATVEAVGPEGIGLSQTVFYPMGGGQPGDRGILRLADGREVAVTDTRKGTAPDTALHIVAADGPLPAPGDVVEAVLDWDHRHRLMRMHTCLHLVCAVVPGAVTGGQISDGKGRLDFDVPGDSLDRTIIEERLNGLISAGHAVGTRWITDDELATHPELVRTMSVKPPVGQGRVRLLEIGDVDLQPCGGTHVRNTAEIGPVTIVKIENKGRQNRRINLAFPAEHESRYIMPYAHPETLVSTAWLHDHLDDPDIRVVDASFKMPGVTPIAAEDYAAGHIPGAVFFDIDDISDHATDLPHMLPSAAKFASRIRDLGLGDGNRLVLYDGAGFAGAARAWWSFRVFGYTNVAVLDGGLKKWKAEGRPVDDLVPPTPARHFTARFNPGMVRDRAQVEANIASKAEQVLDARTAGRFEGTAPEPRPGLRSGHIPGSRNLDHMMLVDPATGTMKSAEALAGLFAEAGIDPSRPVVTSCGSGITASVLALGLHLIGHEQVAVYDGSWSEWGLPGPTPVETGRPRG